MNNFIIYFGLFIIIILNILLLVYLIKKHKEILNKIKLSIEPKFIEIAISPDTNKIINLGIDIWRLESRLSNLSNIQELEKEKIKNSLKRIKKYITNNNLEIKGFNGEKYSEDINAYELKATENTNKEELNGIIKNTIEPVVLSGGIILKPAKIIIYKFNS